MSQTSGDSCTNSFETACAAYLIAIINNTIKHMYNISRVIYPYTIILSDVLQDVHKRYIYDKQPCDEYYNNDI